MWIELIRRLAMNEERLVVATLDGAGICVYRLRDILDGDVRSALHANGGEALTI